ncbi:leucine-rich repeat receptor protein kinase EMS1-like [Ipomoea triloba]|uniref:leucine-rich repeat receptor protein kinase EMS1-like n=1 Tax=Ipomoea triloba TaxID=35885 RepID=UPI00125E76BE|nr:leucine-rich repeat receptor protein kinase EMS1-like [Ipomoea triloba]
MLHPHHHGLMFFFIILLFSSLNYSQSLTTHADDERAILLSLKQHYWGNPSSLQQWDSTSSPCDWPGISCDFDGSVTQIYLSEMNLQGSFPSKIICQLNNLSSIDFSYNSLWGSIPVGLSSCSKLEDLDLSANNFTGKIPGELFSMKMLLSLCLRENMLSSEIPTPMVVHSLVGLDLSRNQLNGSIPGELFSMKRLRSLYLQYNMLSSEIPTTMMVHSLEDLDLSSNQLNGSIPDDIGNLYILGYLKLSNNSLSGPIPAGLLQLQHLSQLSLSYNKLSGEIPTSWAAYSLEDLDLSSNHLNGLIPEDIWNSYNLIRLDLSNNSLRGPIPGVLLQLPQLSHLSLSYNKLSGEIPATLFPLLNLSNIDLSHNHLSGTIPKTFGELLKQRDKLTIDICFNNISGRIPYKLVKERFVHSCFDEANLCSDVKEKGLPACSTEWCSDYTIRGYMDCSSKSKRKSNYIIITCGAIAGILIGLGILILVLRPRVGRRKERDGEEWSMISFQRLKFNKWDILGGLIDENLIGNGGSGKVYRVITKKGQKVAVKSIRLEQKERQGLMEKQFLAEVKILGGIWHNNIVKLLCCIRGKTTKLLVYEYVDKQCVHKWLYGKKRGLTTQVLQWERRLKIAIGAAQGLCYLHHNCSPPIVHRDIKSSNILVDSDFNAKIADFGLAKMMASEGNPETASAIVETFGYIAPEYGSTRKVDAKSDIYSFGVVLLELTTGREAVTGNEDINLAQWAHKHQREGKSAADALDEEIKEPRYLEAMIIIFKLGLACTLSSPSSRPSMKDISQIL